jgi:cytochrome c oxidase subunit IV
MTSEPHHPSTAQYWKIAALLGVLTAIEVAIYYIHLELDLGNLNTISLIALATLKFVIVVAFFMHLRYEKTVLNRFFIGGFVLAACLYTVVLAALGAMIIRGS